MSDTDLAALAKYQPRRFVPDEADLTDPQQVKRVYQLLLDREIASAQQLEDWLADRSETDAAVDQAGSILYVRMTCQTDDASRADAFQAFVEHVEPEVKSLSDQLDRKYLEARERFPLDPPLYEVLDRNTQADVELFRQENVPLQTEESLLSQRYQKTCGAMTVEFRGETYTLPQMSRFLLEPDRDVREGAWRASTDRRLADRDTLEETFDKMLAVRSRIAANAGFDNYRDYKFRRYHRFDYTPADCFRFHESVEKHVKPLHREIMRRRQDQMQLDRLRPWDTAVDPLGRPPLAPFETADELVAGAREAFTRTDPQLGGQFAAMADSGLLDLTSRKGKAPGGYQMTLAESRKPFIFMNAVGVNRDVRTLLHEGGHAFHTLACADQPLHDYRHAPMEFCEVASMAMELLAGEHLDVFYSEADVRRSRREHLEGVLGLLPWVATVDAFQHWLYEHPGHTGDQRREAWLAVMERFGSGVVDYDGLEQPKAYAWHRQLHVFEVPFYYIEYGIAQLGALQVWMRARDSRQAALDGYRQALALGGSRPLPELFAAAGITFDFSAETIAPLVEAVREELARLDAEEA
jgi:oligoendopeptidase F